MTDERTCSFSADRLYRYALEIRWDSGSLFTVIGLNPSTADETKDDPTIRRCKDFAKACHCGALLMLNVFAYRSTDYRTLFTARDPVGPANSPGEIFGRAQDSKYIVAAWGQHSDRKWKYRYQPHAVANEIPRLDCFRVLQSGHPEHPLYLPKTCIPIPFRYE